MYSGAVSHRDYESQRLLYHRESILSIHDLPERCRFRHTLQALTQLRLPLKLDMAEVILDHRSVRDVQAWLSTLEGSIAAIKRGLIFWHRRNGGMCSSEGRRQRGKY